MSTGQSGSPNPEASAIASISSIATLILVGIGVWIFYQSCSALNQATSGIQQSLDAEVEMQKLESNTIIPLTMLSAESGYGSLEVTIEFKNELKQEISWVSWEIKIYDNQGRVVGTGSISAFDVPPGERRIESGIAFKHVSIHTR